MSWWKRGALGTMTDESAKKARLMRMMDEMIKELQRQGVGEVLSNLNFDPKAMAEVMIKAAGWPRWCHSRAAGRTGEY